LNPWLSGEEPSALPSELFLPFLKSIEFYINIPDDIDDIIGWRSVIDVRYHGLAWI